MEIYKETMIAFIRHSERADQIKQGLDHPVIEEKIDPPLSYRGLEIATETGIGLKKYLRENNYTQVKIFSSPFLRSLQTASRVAKEVGVDTIQIDYLLSEALYTYVCKENPYPHILISKHSKEFIMQKYLSGVNFIDVKLTNARNP